MRIRAPPAQNYVRWNRADFRQKPNALQLRVCYSNTARQLYARTRSHNVALHKRPRRSPKQFSNSTNQSEAVYFKDKSSSNRLKMCHHVAAALFTWHLIISTRVSCSLIKITSKCMRSCHRTVSSVTGRVRTPYRTNAQNDQWHMGLEETWLCSCLPFTVALCCNNLSRWWCVQSISKISWKEWQLPVPFWLDSGAKHSKK